MLSRVANNIYWMNRYMERAENYARFIDVNFNLSLDMPPGQQEQWEPLLVAINDEKKYTELYGKIEKNNVIRFLVFDERNPNSIVSCLYRVRENARTVRENISTEMWEQVNRMYLKVKEPGLEGRIMKSDPREFFNAIKLGSQLFYGITESTITYSEAWHFGRMGRFLERADQITRILDVKYHILLPSASSVGSPLDILQWAALLKSASGFSMYKKQYGMVNPSNVIEFLILSRKFPRSILHCLLEAEQSLKEVTSGTELFNNPAEKSLGALRSELEYKEIKDIISFGVHEYMDHIQYGIISVSNNIYNTFFEIKQE